MKDTHQILVFCIWIYILQHHLLNRLFLGFGYHHQELVDYGCVRLALGSLICSIGIEVCFYVSTGLFYLLLICGLA